MSTTAEKHGKRGRAHGWVVVISSACLVLSLGMGLALREQEWQSLDLRMRGQCAVPVFRGKISEDLVLIAIDAETQSQLGRYGQGAWLTREPFVTNLHNIQRHFRPTVLAYDLLFQESSAELDSGEEPDSEYIHGAAQALEELSRQPIKPLAMGTLRDLGRISSAQGNEHFAQALAAVQASNAFQVVLGFNLRGGWSDPQGDRTPAIQREAFERKVSFVADMAIPASDVHGTPADVGCAPAVNVNLPGCGLLHYAALGFINGPRDSDNIVRRLPMVLSLTCQDSGGADRSMLVPSFSLAAVLLHEGVRFPLPEKVVDVEFGKAITIRPPSGRMLRIPIDGRGSLHLNFNVMPADFRAVSFAALAGEPDATTVAWLRKALDGSLALVGTTATGIDVGASPVDASMPLVYAHMVAINNILTDRLLRPPGAAGRVAAALLVFAVFTAALLVVRSSRLAALVVVAMACYACVAWVALPTAGCALPVVQPLIYMGTAGFAVLSFRYVREERARLRIRRIFGCMVSNKVLAYLEEYPHRVALAGHAAETTVMFTDITEFTALGDRFSAGEMVRLLNCYLTPATQCILDGDGYVDKYMGDGIMAVWGAPYPDPEHAVKACRAALRHRAILVDVNRRIEADFGARVRVRMGVNSGMVVAGNIGSDRKFQYTVIGDVVNLASRLEPVNKDFGVDIILGVSTRSRIADTFTTRELGRIMVRGRREVVPIFELVGEVGEVPECRLKVIRRYEAALHAFYGRQWDAVEGILQEPVLAADGPSLFLSCLVDRCRRSALPDSWQGEHVRSDKE